MMDPLECLARLSDYIPNPGQHRSLRRVLEPRSGRGRARGVRRGDRGRAEAHKRCSPSWARLIAKVYQADPLMVTRCGQRMSIIAFLTGQMAIGQILDRLGLSTTQAEKPPLPVREVLRVPEHGDGWGVPAEWECAPGATLTWSP